MSEETAPGAVPPPPAVPPTPGQQVQIRGNQNSKIIVAAGSVTMTSRPPLPVTDIPQSELRAVRRAWVELSVRDERVRTASDAIERLTGGGPRLAVVAGPPGYGKRAAGIKALWEVSQAEERSRGKALKLQSIAPDWEKPGLPDIGELPDEPGRCYLLDVAAEIGSWHKPGLVAQQLVSYAEELKFSGSFLVVIADEHGWPEGVSVAVAGVVARATARPSPHRVARSHLEYVHHVPDRIRWLTTPTEEGSVGEAGHLLTDSSRPDDAARLAAKLASAEDSPEGLKNALSAFREWRTAVKNVFTETENKPEDRALLISSLFLNGKDALTIQNSARALLGDDPETDVRTILTGPDLTTRLTKMGAEVNGRTVSLDHKSGYARAVLLHLWQQRADIHPHLLQWLDTVTAPKGPGADRLAAIGDLLVELAVAENDIRVVKQIHAWIDKGADSAEHRELIARVLTVAAEADTLGVQVRALLLDSAQDGSEAVATVVALVCRGEFAEHYPRQALVRLRHILDRPATDEAVQTAQEALRDIAARDGQLPRVWSTVIKWATEKKHLAGHRAFLSLLDPRVDPYVLQVMLAAAEQKEDIKEALLDGWNAALADTRVEAECRQLLTAWAEARKTADMPTELLTDLLNQIMLGHLVASPVAALIFGEPGIADGEAVIDLRKDLRLPPTLSSLITAHERASAES
ncbi:hypothetical protein ACIO93_34125 [Streptomyces sp. NPDC087903]|uniref:hypothetical protein n=1 Tax=Streptomyces sp. NPDC087903 TaxID=3365819 RepID=UPI0037FB6914